VQKRDTKFLEITRLYNNKWIKKRNTQKLNTVKQGIVNIIVKLPKKTVRRCKPIGRREDK
jgi:hypothetical protein